MKLFWTWKTKLMSLLILILNYTILTDKKAYNCNENDFKEKINKDDIAAIENHINTLRARIANGLENSTGDLIALPTAENMNVILWDDDLAEYAQEWANSLNNNCEEIYFNTKTDDKITKSYGNTAELII